MKRSEINIAIASAIEFFAKYQFALPPFAAWSPRSWCELDGGIEMFVERKLGWDVTDFNSGRFESVGLTLFTLRNGLLSGASQSTFYAEKIMHVREQQVTPLHYHYRKTEDIINRGTGTAGDLPVRFYNSADDGGLLDTRVEVVCDGTLRSLEPGEPLLLRSGESVTIPPRLYHTFHAVNGSALIGEVSSVNEDDSDNRFYQFSPRYPKIVEDEPPLRLLCTEYPMRDPLKSNSPGANDSENF